jgi:predicted RNase H-like HicB family nuclease
VQITKYDTMTSMKSKFTVVIERDGDWFVGSCPELPGANGRGRTQEECLESLRDAVSLILEDRRDDPPDAAGTTIPVR